MDLIELRAWGAVDGRTDVEKLICCNVRTARAANHTVLQFKRRGFPPVVIEEAKALRDSNMRQARRLQREMHDDGREAAARSPITANDRR